MNKNTIPESHLNMMPDISSASNIKNKHNYELKKINFNQLHIILTNVKTNKVELNSLNIDSY